MKVNLDRHAMFAAGAARFAEAMDMVLKYTSTKAPR